MKLVMLRLSLGDIALHFLLMWIMLLFFAFEAPILRLFVGMPALLIWFWLARRSDMKHWYINLLASVAGLFLLYAVVV